MISKLKKLKLQSAVTLFEKEMKAVTGGSGGGSGSGNPNFPHYFRCTCTDGRSPLIRCRYDDRELCCTAVCEYLGSGYGDEFECIGSGEP